MNHEQRRVDIAEAAWRIVLRQGVAGVTVRSVAAEANLATASLRQAFPTQGALLTFCFDLVLERASARISSLHGAGTVRERARQTLLEVLPLDQQRHAEMQVWLAFATASLAQPQLAPTYARGHDALRQLCRSVLNPLVPSDEVEVEAARLHALLDGLAMHLVTRAGPTRSSTEEAYGILATHLDSLG